MAAILAHYIVLLYCFLLYFYQLVGRACIRTPEISNKPVRSALTFKPPVFSERAPVVTADVKLDTGTRSKNQKYQLKAENVKVGIKKSSLLPCVNILIPRTFL